MGEGESWANKQRSREKNGRKANRTRIFLRLPPGLFHPLNFDSLKQQGSIFSCCESLGCSLGKEGCKIPSKIKSEGVYFSEYYYAKPRVVLFPFNLHNTLLPQPTKTNFSAFQV